MTNPFTIINGVISTFKAGLKLAVYAKDAEMLKKISDLNLSLANAHNEVADLKTENLKLKNELTKMRHSKRRNHD